MSNDPGIARGCRGRLHWGGPNFIRVAGRATRCVEMPGPGAFGHGPPFLIIAHGILPDLPGTAAVPVASFHRSVSPIPGMPLGKLAGVRCVQLDAQLRCRLFGDLRCPAVWCRVAPSTEMWATSRAGPGLADPA